MNIIMLTNSIEAPCRNICLAFGVDYNFGKSHDFDKIPETIQKIKYNNLVENY